jgi:tetratricopeptide (TPR) repeat protein
VLVLGLTLLSAGCGREATPPPAADQKLDPALQPAYRSIQAGRYDEASATIDAYLGAGRADANVGQAEFLRGLGAHQQGRYAQALTHFDRCAALEPSYLANLYYRGMAAFELGDLSKARASLEAYSKGQPDKEEALFALGLIDLEEDRATDARMRIARAIALAQRRLTEAAQAADARRDLGRYHARLADACLRMDELEAARAALESAVEFAPELAEPWSKLAHVLVRLGDEDAAARARDRWRELEAARAKGTR